MIRRLQVGRPPIVMVTSAAVLAAVGTCYQVVVAAHHQQHTTRVVLWTDTRGGGALHVHLDGRPIGVLVDYFTAGPPLCASGRGVLVVDVVPGTLHVEATDEVGRRWRRRFLTNLGGCVLVRLGPRDAVNGPLTIPAESSGAASDEYPIPEYPDRDE